MAVTANTIALITKYSPDLFDDVYKGEATSSVLKKSNADVQFTGAKTVKVAKRQFGRLHNYNRNNVGDPRVVGQTPYGYQDSAAGLTWEEHTLKMDRAASYPIEMFDNEESGGKIVGESVTYVSKYVLVPEIDAYCWSSVFQKAGKKIVNGTSASYPEANYNPLQKPFHALNLAFKWEMDHEVPENDQLIVASTSFYLALQETTEAGIVRKLDFSTHTKDENVTFQIGKYSGREIVVVPPDRFRTEYDFDGEGYVATAASKDIDLIVMPKSAASHIVKFQKIRILDGDVATAMTRLDGYVLLARVYHDVIVFDNKAIAIYAVAGFSSSTLEDSYEISLDKGRVDRILFTKGDIWTTYALNLVNGNNPVAVGDVVAANDVFANVVAVGSTLTANDNVAIIRSVQGQLKVVAIATIDAAKKTGIVAGTIA